MTPHLRSDPHRTVRPLWICGFDAQPWPCAQTRLNLRRRFQDNPVPLYVHLSGLLHEAMTDLYTLNPDTAPEPYALFARFLGWAPSRHHQR